MAGLTTLRRLTLKSRRACQAVLSLGARASLGVPIVIEFDGYSRSPPVLPSQPYMLADI